MSEPVFTPEQINAIKAIVRALLAEPTGVIPSKPLTPEQEARRMKHENQITAAEIAFIQTVVRGMLPEIIQAVAEALDQAIQHARIAQGA